MAAAPVTIKAMLPAKEADQLVRLARRNERSIAAEVRLAIRAHLATAKAAA